MRRSSAIRAIAWGVVAAGISAPLVRKRVRAPAVLTQTVAFAAPLGLSVAMRRSRVRDVAVCGLQMWAYVAAYKSPHDDPDAQEQKTRFRYPIVADRVLGLGELPTVRLQRALARNGPDGPEWRALDRVLVWTHWAWFTVPHGTVAYILLRHPARFPRAAAMTYAVFNIGASIYWVLPTAPPWYAAEGAYALDGVPAVSRAPGAVAAVRGLEPSEAAEGAAVRRMMVEYGEHFWRDGWGPLYSVLGGNPLAAMPSLHFATSLMAALLLAEVGPVAGALGFAYAFTLGFALVYLGEHYVVDLLAGAALTGAVRRLAPHAAPLAGRLARGVAGLEAIAHEGGSVAA
ncbi:MAG TPA: phosphatase PAP2 family protein [Solirubrobacteraceae bacterium]|nr:phosphatase PAP2 family protein [Solirubrobacteraceae bacterium]